MNGSGLRAQGEERNVTAHTARLRSNRLNHTYLRLSLCNYVSLASLCVPIIGECVRAHVSLQKHTEPENSSL